MAQPQLWFLPFSWSISWYNPYRGWCKHFIHAFGFVNLFPTQIYQNYIREEIDANQCYLVSVCHVVSYTEQCFSSSVCALVLPDPVLKNWNFCSLMYCLWADMLQRSDTEYWSVRKVCALFCFMLLLIVTSVKYAATCWFMSSKPSFLFPISPQYITIPVQFRHPRFM